MKKLSYLIRTNIRNLFNYKRFAFINIIGLSVGLTISLLIFLYVRYESSFDNFNPNAGNIYRVVARNSQNGSIGVPTPFPLSVVLKKDYPEIDKVFGLLRTWDEIKAGQQKFENLTGAIVENDFFEVFSFPLQYGNPVTIFKDPFEAVVTEKFAYLLFGNTNPKGQTFEYEKTVFTITGVIDDIPSNSIFNFDYFLSDNFRYTYYPDLMDQWYNSGLYPSIVLSRAPSVKVMLQRKRESHNKLTFQKGFVVHQFVISIGLGITQFFIFKQISFMQNHEAGFNKENLIALSARELGNNDSERLKNSAILVQELEKYQAQYGYGKAAITEFVPGFGFRNQFKAFPGGNTYPEGMEVISCDIDENFPDVFGVKMVQGRFFSKEYSTDRDAIIINESVFKKFGWTSIEGKTMG